MVVSLADYVHMLVMKMPLSKCNRLMFFLFSILIFMSGCNESSETTSANKPAVNLIEACTRNDIAAVEGHISNKSDLDQTDDKGSTPLMIASSFGHTEIVKALIDAGAYMDKQNKDGTTALHIAAFMCEKEIVQLLLDAGVDKSAKDNTGSTALQSVEAPYMLVKPIYDFLATALAPVGFTMDYEKIKTMRPEIAKMLR